MVIGVLVILFTIFVCVYTFFQLRGDLDNSAEEIILNLKLAQSKTLASEGLNQYGIYFDSTTSPNQYVLFKGASYASRDVSADIVFKLPQTLEIYSINLGGGNEVVFKRVTGASMQSGSVSLRLKKDPAKNITIYIENSGRIGAVAPSSPSDTRIKDSRHVHFDYSRVIDVNTEKITLDFGSGVTKDIILLNNLQGGQIDWEGQVLVNDSNQKIRIHTHRLNNPDTQFCVHRDLRYNNTTLVVTISGDTTGNLIQYSSDGLNTTFSSSYVSNLIWQ